MTPYAQMLGRTGLTPDGAAKYHDVSRHTVQAWSRPSRADPEPRRLDELRRLYKDMCDEVRRRRQGVRSDRQWPDGVEDAIEGIVLMRPGE